MSERWIVSAYKFKEHETLEIAEAERNRLALRNKDKRYRVYRIKQNVQPSRSREAIEAHEARADEATRLLRNLLKETTEALEIFDHNPNDALSDQPVIKEARAFLEQHK